MEQEVAKNTDDVEQVDQESAEQTLGQYLKQARDDKGLSIESVARHTRINLSNLEYLETDNKEKLPNIAYVRGFVKTLAKTYDLSADETIAKLEELYQISTSDIETSFEDHPMSRQAEGMTTEKPSKSFEISESLKYKVLSAIAALSIGFFVFINLDKKSKVQKRNIEEEVVVKAHVLTENSPLSDEKKKKEEVVKEDVKEEPKAQEPIEQKKEEPVAVVEKVEEKKIVKKEEPKKEEKPKEIKFYNFPSPLFGFKDISEEEKNEIIPSNYRNSFVDGKQNVFIRAVEGDSWIVYKKDNDPIKKFTLRAGRYILIKGDEVLLRLANIDKTRIFLNGDLLAVKSRSGVKSLTFPKNLSETLKLPLFIFNKDGSVQTSKEYIEEKNTSNN